MFTGLVEEVGRIEYISLGEHGGRITILADKVLDGIQLGDSIAVNGICLTVTSFGSRSFTVDVMGETLRRTSLRGSDKNTLVNLERAMQANGRFGGHLVSGHIDGTGKIISVKKEGISHWLTIQPEENLLRYIPRKGSVALDGVSLTVADIGPSWFQVSIIPHTGTHTVLLQKKEGDVVNVETDLVAKYLERLLRQPEEEKSKKLDMEFLLKCGF